MNESIKTLLTSKRSLVVLLTIIIDSLIYFGLDVDLELADKLATLVTTLGGVLVGGISISDHGKATSQPVGVGHKGR